MKYIWRAQAAGTIDLFWVYMEGCKRKFRWIFEYVTKDEVHRKWALCFGEEDGTALG